MSPVATDPLTLLIVASLLLAGVVIVPQLSPRLPLWTRVLARAAVFVSLTLLVQGILGSPLRPHFVHAHAGEQFWEQLIEAAWWLVAARVAVGLARLFVVLENRPHETRIVSDLLAGAIYVVTALAIVNFCFGVPIGGLLATSGVIAIVLGLALQSTLSDVFSGVAVGLERPYKVGDLVWVEGGIEGRVLQVNWRSTHVATIQDTIAVVPNSIMAKSRLVNRSAPTPRRGDTVTLSLDANAVPEQCLAVLDAAVRACRVMLSDPGPSLGCTGLHGEGTVYEISFSVDSSEHLPAARTELFSQIHRHLRHAGIALAVTGLAAPPPVPVPTPAELMRQSDLFGVIEPAERDLLAAYFTPQWLPRGATLIREGEMPEALFLLASGTAEITRDEPDGPRVVYRMSPGESLGTVGLISGAPYTATATALTAIKAYRLGKADIAMALKVRPQLAAALEMLVQRGQEALRRSAAAQQDVQLDQPELFLPRLRNFLRLLGS